MLSADTWDVGMCLSAAPCMEKTQIQQGLMQPRGRMTQGGAWNFVRSPCRWQGVLQKMAAAKEEGQEWVTMVAWTAVMAVTGPWEIGVGRL